MAKIQTYETRINEVTGEEYNVLIEDYEVEEPEPQLPTLDELQQRLQDLMAQAQQAINDINNGNWIPF